TMKLLLDEALSSSITSKVGHALSRQALADLPKRMDYSETGGAPLLGIHGICTICHGSSNANAIKNAIRFTSELAAARIDEKIEAELGRLDDSGSWRSVRC